MLYINKIYEGLIQNKYLLFLFFWILALTLYGPAYKGGFYEDFCEFAEKYKTLPFPAFLNLTPSSLYQGVNLFHYIFLQLFDLAPLPWFLLFTALHALNATLVFFFFRNFLGMHGLFQNKIIAFAGSLIWLLSPVVCEAVIWKATSHYLTSTALIFSILNITLLWLKDHKGQRLACIYILYAISTTLLELFYLTPVLIALTITALYAGKASGRALFKKILAIAGPLILIWCLYYLIFSLASHKTTARADFDISEVLAPGYVISRLLKYLFYIIGMEFLFSPEARKMLHQFTEYQGVWIITGAAVLFYLMWGCFKYRNWSPGSRAIFSLFLLTGCSCMIILPMWFYDTFPYQGSRYYYFPGIFFYMLFATVIVQAIPARKISRVILLAYWVACICAAYLLILNVRGASTVFYGLIKNFKWQQKKEVFLLNLPILQNGVGIIGSDNPSNFAYHMRIFRNDTATAEIFDISSYNMTTRWDGAHVTVLDSLQIKVTPNQYGSWWWHAGFGASDYENDRYKVTFIDNGFSYLLQFKKTPGKDAVILFQVGDQWKEVDRARWNEEQW